MTTFDRIDRIARHAAIADDFGFQRPDTAVLARRQLQFSIALVLAFAIVGGGVFGFAMRSRAIPVGDSAAVAPIVAPIDLANLSRG